MGEGKLARQATAEHTAPATVPPARNAPALQAVPAADAALSHNLNGQRLGRKGRDTRDRILMAATRLLYCAPREGAFSLSAVAREANLGLTSLYNYFGDITELLEAILEPVMESAEVAYLAPLRSRWSDEEVGRRCYEFVAAYQAFWEKHSRLLHLRNSMSDQQDARMTRIRIKSTQPIIGLIVAQMGGDPQAPRSREFAMATVLMIGIERSITISTDNDLPVRLAQDIQHDAEHFLHPCARLMELAILDARSAA